MGEEPLHCLVEVPKGSRNKYRWDRELGAIKLDRFLFSSIAYPTDYGFVPGTLTADGESLSAMICVSAPTFPGCVIPARAIAAYRADGRDNLLCVPQDDPNWNGMERLDDLSAQLRSEIEHFWSIVAGDSSGWEDRAAALEAIAESRKRYRERE
jgi:inorganic pyrophosphatase